MTITVSIHAPARGATVWGFPVACDEICFNPRTAPGVRRKSHVISFLSTVQSTHPHGVRRSDNSWYGVFRFHPRTRTGATFEFQHIVDIAQFQSTHPHGVRRTITFLTIIRYVFQSRTRTGVRPPSCLSLIPSGFNPRTHGCDCPCLMSVIYFL
jgi:hypothetical protein